MRDGSSFPQRVVQVDDPRYWGTQTLAVWGAGQQGTLPLADLGHPPEGLQDEAPRGLWRIAVTGRGTVLPTLALQIGAGHAVSELTGVLLPALFYSPGSLRLTARLPAPAEPGGTRCQVQITPVQGGGQQWLRTLGLTGDVLPSSAVLVQALEASSVQPPGAPAPIVLAAGQTLRVAAPTLVTGGTVLVEHEL